jgi:hypothetical protein
MPDLCWSENVIDSEFLVQDWLLNRDNDQYVSTSRRNVSLTMQMLNPNVGVVFMPENHTNIAKADTDNTLTSRMPVSAKIASINHDQSSYPAFDVDVFVIENP